MVKRCFERLKNVKENEQDTDFSFVFVTFTIFSFPPVSATFVLK